MLGLIHIFAASSGGLLALTSIVTEQKAVWEPTGNLEM
jgi:hypothetical protein